MSGKIITRVRERQAAARRMSIERNWPFAADHQLMKVDPQNPTVRHPYIIRELPPEPGPMRRFFARWFRL